MCFGSSRQNVLVANSLDVLAASSYIVWMPALQHPRGWLDAISSTSFWWHVRWDCSASLSVVMWHCHPLWFGRLLDSPAPFVMMQSPWLAWWSGVFVLNFSYRSEFDASFLCGCRVCLRVVGFVFAWSSHSPLSWLWYLSSRGHGVNWMNEWVGCLNQYSFCLRVALLEGGTARGWRWLFTWIDDPRNICDHC